jgi:hypothetical protein
LRSKDSNLGFPQARALAKIFLFVTNRGIPKEINVMPRKKIEKELVRDMESPEKTIEEKKDEEEDDPSPKKVASDDDEVVAEDAEDLLEEDEDDPLNDFMTDEEESW